MNELKGRKEVSICLAILFFALAFILKFPNDYFNKILYAISYLLVGVEVVIKALKNIKNHSFLDENFLMTISTIGAFLINRWAEAVAVMLFYQIGELFQDYAVTKSRKSIASLMNIRPDYANLIIASETIKVDPVKVKVGDVIVVKPGEKIPLDGIVIEGNSSLDTKALTGESMPVDVTKNDQVLSGTINLNGVIKIKVTSEFSNSTVNQILNLVENVSSKKAKTENFITKFAYYYTPIVIIVAIFMIIFMPLLTPISFKTWLYRGLEFLVVSCPCALVVSIPLSFFGGIGKASQCGILIKGGNYLEALTNLKTVIFDKTGTLTKGVFKVQEIKTKSIQADELLKYASYAEIYSSHPLASAIKEKYEKELDSSKITSIKELSGLGIKAKIDGHLVLVGNDKLMQKYKIKGYKNLDETVLNIAIDGEYKGYILVADEIKPEAKGTLQKLKENGIKKIFLFTGDKNADTRQFKEMLIDEVNTNMLPQDKIAKMEDILAHKDVKEVVAFVGDGINDAPVLALADIGIAMGLIGADSALEAADIIIMNDELDKINEAILIAKKTMRIVKENIVLAIGVKLIVLLLASLGVASMWEAVFADVGVTLIAVINALRILKTQTI